MSADHLTQIPSPVLAAVQAVLAGAEVATAAARHHLDPAELDDAVRLYHAAGLAALTSRGGQDTFQTYVQFPDWAQAEAIASARLGPALDALQHAGAVQRWWCLRKHPCWRLRMHQADSVAVTEVLDDLARAGVLARWWPTLYEPETYAFGGPASMDVIHDLFAADTRGVLNYLRQSAPGIERRELSLLLLSALLRSAGLDHFERGDVFARLARLRPAPHDTAHLQQLTADVRILLCMTTQAIRELCSSPGPLTYAATWFTAFQAAGSQLQHLAADGHLDRGIRAVLTQTAIFHWNRLGLSATTQGLLARTATMALLPNDPPTT